MGEEERMKVEMEKEKKEMNGEKKKKKRRRWPENTATSSLLLLSKSLSFVGATKYNIYMVDGSSLSYFYYFFFFILFLDAVLPCGPMKVEAWCIRKFLQYFVFSFHQLYRYTFSSSI